MKKVFCLCVIFILSFLQIKAQNQGWKFAHVSDTHIGNETANEDLQRTVKDINANAELQFVVISGDITEFGSNEELYTARSILNGLNKPWYIIPGNHDMNWSESGGNSFKTIFGAETFAFKHNGFLFLGTNCGPNMRMSPGQVPRENIVWLDSVINVTPKQVPIIFVNHYPQDSALNNWYEIIDRLKTRNIQLLLCGHGHSNHHLNFEGIPGVMGRSNLRAKDSVGGYNIVTISRDSVYYNERRPGFATKPTWTKDRLYMHDFTAEPGYKRPLYAVNQKYPAVQTMWSIQDKSDIGSGTVIGGDVVFVANTAGWVKAYKVNNGKLVWVKKTGGKIYGTPAVSGKYVIVASTDKHLYCFDKNTGATKWKVPADKPIVASPVIANSKVFCGGSDGHFKCFDLETGKLIWDFNQVKSFVVTKPLLYNGKIYFGSWGNQFYALDQKDGTLIWSWSNGSANRMFSAAACYPVAVSNRLFIVSPDRFMTCIDALSGKEIWRKQDPKIRVRESMGLSADSSLIYVKTMDGDVLGLSATADSMVVNWRGDGSMGYDISPSSVQEHSGLVFALSNSGAIYAFKRSNGALAWIHKLSNCLVNPVSFISNTEMVATTMDGKISKLKYDQAR
jgi:outer membrane protein assembly factor BamB/predicted MPP superfamily phosphohydrolase